jgi:hypothetical protein
LLLFSPSSSSSISSPIFSMISMHSLSFRYTVGVDDEVVEFGCRLECHPLSFQTAFHLVSQQSKLAGEPSKCHFNSNRELGEVINKSCTNLTIVDKSWRKTKQNPKNDNCRKKLAKVVRKRQKCSRNGKSVPETTKVGVKYIDILVASENLAITNTPSGLSHTTNLTNVFHRYVRWSG